MFKKLTIKVKLLLLLIIPLLALIIIAGELMYKDYNTLTSYKNLEKAVILSTKVSQLVHETQKERGATAGFLSSKGKKFNSSLPIQREVTNKRIEELKQYLQDIELEDIDKELAHDMDKVMSTISRISSIRNSVTSLSIKASKAISYYTNLNNHLLILILDVSKISESPKVTKQLIGYSNFLLSKERA